MTYFGMADGMNSYRSKGIELCKCKRLPVGQGCDRQLGSRYLVWKKRAKKMKDKGILA